ncbi:MAG TPA: serine hydrolase domain-containing protein [Acidobacteriota bacterium]|nr:serine hydrolase domain-containing protein [Acidobacteriota bacterium]
MKRRWTSALSRMTAAVLLAALVLTFGLAQEGAEPADLEARFDQLAELASAEMKKLGVPGAALGIIYQGRRYTRGLGVTNVDHPLTVTDETLFQIGSITKTFTGTLLLSLAEEGKVDLDAPVRRYLPEFRVSDHEASEKATVRHLLTHVGGWEGDVFQGYGEGDDAAARYVEALADVEQLAPLGTVWSYNNSGFVVAGHVIEAVTGQTYEDALHQRLLDRLGLKQCFIRPADVMTHRFAVGHGGGSSGPRVLRPWPIGRYAAAAGALACSVRDLLRYARFHLGEIKAPEVLDAEALQRMHEPLFTKHGSESRMALTWHVDSVEGVDLIAHGGGTLGQISMLTLVPERDFAFALLTNSGAGGQLTRQIRRTALRKFLGLEETDPEPIKADPEQLRQYVGRYARPFAEVELTLEVGKLQARLIPKRGFPDQDAPVPPPSPPFSVGLYRQDGLIVLEGPREGSAADIVRLEDGSIGWLRFGGRIHRRMNE